MKQVDRVPWNGDIKAVLGRYIASNQPVIVEGIEGFPPTQWTVEELERRYGDVEIRVLVSDSQKFAYDEKRERTITRLTLHEFLERGVRNIGADGKHYALGKSPVDQFQGLRDEIVLPSELQGFVSGVGRFLEKNIWMSPHGTSTALHFDTQENFNIQIQGEKSFWLYPPAIDGMYPYKLNSQASYLSPVSPRDLDRGQYPDFPEDLGIEAVLGAGQLLYLPYSWWHQVDTTGYGNLNVNIWWLPRWKLLGLWQQSLRGAFVLAHRLGAHPHRRAESRGRKQAA